MVNGNPNLDVGDTNQYVCSLNGIQRNRKKTDLHAATAIATTAGWLAGWLACWLARFLLFFLLLVPKTVLL